MNALITGRPSCWQGGMIVTSGVLASVLRNLIAWPLAAHAQQPDRIRHIGVLMAAAESDREGQALVAAFREGLQKLGWAEGRNIRIDIGWAPDVESMQRIAKELVAQQPDLMLTQNTPTTAAMLQQTGTIPIIFANVADPVGSGFVAGLPRPGGNVTGFTVTEPTIGGKWLELLKDIAPRVTRVESPSFSRTLPIQSAAALSRACRGREATSPASPLRSRRLAASGWSCLRTLRRASPGSNPHHFRERCRSSRQRLCRGPAAAGRQRHRLHRYGADDWRQVAGAA